MLHVRKFWQYLSPCLMKTMNSGNVNYMDGIGAPSFSYLPFWFKVNFTKSV